MKGSSPAVAGLAVLIAVFFGSTAALARPEDAVGRWSTPSRHGVVEIALCEASVCGRLMLSDAIRASPDARDTKNSDTALRNRPLKGLLLLSGFHRAQNGWSGGTIYNPEDGGLYHATIAMPRASSAPDTLELKGCIVWPLCKSQTWHRVQ